jgi:hypothetical protein
MPLLYSLQWLEIFTRLPNSRFDEHGLMLHNLRPDDGGIIPISDSHDVHHLPVPLKELAATVPEYVFENPEQAGGVTYDV